MVFALLRASFEASVLLEHTKHLSSEIYYSGDVLEMDESNSNPSPAFKKLASRCPNLCVVQNRRPELGDDQHPNVFPSLRLYEGSCNTLSYRVKVIYNTSFCMMLEHPCLSTYKVSPSHYCASSTLREQIG